MAQRTVRQLADLDMILFNQLLALDKLIRWRLPGHARNLVHWSEVFFGVAMAVETPTHRQRAHLLRRPHLVHLAVTGRTAHTLRHVDIVREVNEIAQVMHKIPLDWLLVLPALNDRLDQRVVCGYL